MIRAVACALALLACKPHVIELGRPDGPIDGTLAGCACRIPCVAATVECVQIGSGSTCGSDNYCTGSLGTCTTTTPSPCSGSAATASVCTRDETSTVACGQ